MRAWGPAAAWAAVLFLLSAWPDPGGITWVPVNDKVVHVGLYAVLGAALAFGRASSGTSMSHLGLIVVGALYGASDEWHQMYVPGRFADVFDWIADVVGVSMGYGLWWKLRGGRPSGTTSTDTAT